MLLNVTSMVYIMGGNFQLVSANSSRDCSESKSLETNITQPLPVETGLLFQFRWSKGVQRNCAAEALLIIDMNQMPRRVLAIFSLFIMIFIIMMSLKTYVLMASIAISPP